MYYMLYFILLNNSLLFSILMLYYLFYLLFNNYFIYGIHVLWFCIFWFKLGEYQMNGTSYPMNILSSPNPVIKSARTVICNAIYNGKLCLFLIPFNWIILLNIPHIIKKLYLCVSFLIGIFFILPSWVIEK